MKISEDFKDFLKLLYEKNVEYLLIGGFAVVYYGYVRNTGDMDIWIRLTSQNVELTADALDEFGYATKEQTLPYLSQPGRILRMGMPPFRLEVSNEIDGVEFDECYSKRVTLNVEGIPINLISLSDLIENKQASGRHKDLADVEELKMRNQIS